MRRALALLFAGLALAAPALAQFGAPKPGVEAEAHIFSAFTTRADPRVLAENVALGPALREQLGADADRHRIYDSLAALVAGKPLRSRLLPVTEAVTHASLPGLNVAEPLVLLEAGDVQLLLQYASGQKNVAFVEQLAGTTLVAPTPPQAPKPAPIVAVPLPTEPPPPAPAVLAAPAPVAAPPLAPVVTPAVAAPRPRGECVVKPVMSEDDLWNCSAPGQASIPQSAAPAPVASQSAAPPAAEKAPAECVIKPVMSAEDLRACAAASRSRPVAAVETSAPMVAAPASAAAPVLQAAPQRECVIKPVMSEEDLRVCAAASKSRPSAAVEASSPAATVQAPATAPQPAVQRDCVIKPVMSEEDLRACSVRR